MTNPNLYNSSLKRVLQNLFISFISNIMTRHLLSHFDLFLLSRLIRDISENICALPSSVRTKNDLPLLFLFHSNRPLLMSLLVAVGIYDLKLYLLAPRDLNSILLSLDSINAFMLAILNLPI